MALPPLNMQGMRYPSPGRCIYCGCTSDLRDEHIMPLGLGGTAYIDDASCSDCEKITSYLDGFIASKVFGPMRVHAGMQSPRSRRRKEKRPTHLPVEYEIAGKPEIRVLPLKDHPHHIVVPIWEWPGITQAIQPSGNFGQLKGALYWIIPESFHAAIGMRAGEQATVNFRGSRIVNVHTFARGLAKIGYCHAVAQYGLDGFRHLVLPDLILGKYPHIPYFVGSVPGDPPPPIDPSLRHSLSMDRFTLGRLKLLMVTIRLFANSGTDQKGMPIYKVVVGVPPLKSDA